MFFIYEIFLESSCVVNPSITSPVNVPFFTFLNYCDLLLAGLSNAFSSCPPPSISPLHCSQKDRSYLCSKLHSVVFLLVSLLCWVFFNSVRNVYCFIKPFTFIVIICLMSSITLVFDSCILCFCHVYCCLLL